MVTITCNWTNFFVTQSNNISEAREPQSYSGPSSLLIDATRTQPPAKS